jgi:hypothetical protein
LVRILLVVVAVLALGAGATAYALRAPDEVAVVVEQGPVELTPGRLLFVDDASGRVASVPLSSPGGPRRVSSLSCKRFFTAAKQGLCLADRSGPFPGSVSIFVDQSLTETHHIDVAGVPNRAKLSADGRMASWTTFVTGDSYSQTGAFSTRTGIYDRETKEYRSNLEEGTRIAGMKRAEDMNFWGVTFTADNLSFYATMSTAGKTYLINGEAGTTAVKPLRENVECPSLSPDGKRVAFKKRVPGDGARPWRQHVLDLTTMVETPLAETRGIDDQVVWLDNDTIAYGLPGEGIWAVQANGEGTPRQLVPHASSPSVVR